MDLSPQQLAMLERLVASGIAPLTLATYPNAVCVQRGTFAAALLPAPDGRLTMLGEPGYLIEGKIAVAILKEGKKHYVWKKKSIPATEETESELQSFRKDLLAAIS